MDKFELKDCEIKALAEKGRVLRFVGSTAIRDRYGDEIAVEGWDLKNYKRNPVFLWAHRREILPIGRAVNVSVEGEKLVFDIEFAPAEINEFAEQVYQHYKEGFLKGVSVGFQSHKSERFDETTEEELKRKKAKPDLWAGRKFLKQELLELSACPVGANPEALLVSKSLDVAPTEEAREAFDEWITEALEDDQEIEAGEASGGEVKGVGHPDMSPETLIPCSGHDHDGTNSGPIDAKAVAEYMAKNVAAIKKAAQGAAPEAPAAPAAPDEKTAEKASSPTLADVIAACARLEARFVALEQKIAGPRAEAAPRAPLADADADDAGDGVGRADGDGDADVELVADDEDLIEVDLSDEEGAGAGRSLYTESVFEVTNK